MVNHNPDVRQVETNQDCAVLLWQLSGRIENFQQCTWAEPGGLQRLEIWPGLDADACYGGLGLLAAL